MKISSILFGFSNANNAELASLGVTYGQQSSAKESLSQLTLNSQTTNRRQVAKISNLAYPISLLLTGEAKMKIVYCPSIEGVYTEFERRNERFHCIVTDNGISSDMQITSSRTFAFPLFAYALGNARPEFDEVKALAKQIFTDYGVYDKVEETDLFKICDSFYRAMITAFPNADVPEMELKQEELRQLERAEQNAYPIMEQFLVGIDEFDAVSFATSSASNGSIPAVTSDFFESCQNGEYLLPLTWGTKSMEKVVSLSELDTFVPTRDFENLVNLTKFNLLKIIERLDMGLTGAKAIGSNCLNMILTGNPGSGKSTMLRALAATLGLPFYVIPTLKNGEEDEFQGKTKAIGNSFVFEETPFLEAYKNGGICVLEEANMAPPSLIMGVLGQAIEKPYILMEGGNKPVTRHPMFVFVATCNTMTTGSQTLNEAFTSRCSNVFLINDPDENEFIKMLVTNSGCDDQIVRKVYKTYKSVLLAVEDEEDVVQSLTTRHCLAALNQYTAGIPLKDAITNTLINTIALKSADLAQEVYEGIVEPMKN